MTLNEITRRKIRKRIGECSSVECTEERRIESCLGFISIFVEGHMVRNTTHDRYTFLIGASLNLLPNRRKVCTLREE